MFRMSDSIQGGLPEGSRSGLGRVVITPIKITRPSFRKQSALESADQTFQLRPCQRPLSVEFYISGREGEAKAHVFAEPLDVISSPAVVEQADVDASGQVRLRFGEVNRRPFA